MADDLTCEYAAFGDPRCVLADEIKALRKRVQELEHPTAMDEAIAAGDGTLHGAIDYWQGRAERAEAEIAAAREDAERYRWLRETMGADLDAAIDTARGKA